MYYPKRIRIYIFIFIFIFISVSVSDCFCLFICQERRLSISSESGDQEKNGDAISGTGVFVRATNGQRMAHERTHHVCVCVRERQMSVDGDWILF